MKDAEAFFESLASELKAQCGIEKITFELLPQSSVERSTKLQRLRTEIMAGEGPDLFIVQTTCNSMNSDLYKDALFNYPEKSLEVGLFLPLDEYMENSSRFTDWDAQTQAVLEAGRNREGQMLIPMVYHIPLLIYPAEGVDIPYTTELTRRAILDDEDTAKLGAVLYSAVSYKKDGDKTATWTHYDAVRDTLGQYADYEKEELLFTEEELYSVASEAFELKKVMGKNEWPYYEWTDAFTGDLTGKIRSSDVERCLLPRYTKDGGVTARVMSFMAVNRSTQFPEEAFSVIDYLMREEAQSKSMLYDYYFCDGFPLQNDLGSEEKPLNAARGEKGLPEPYMSELLQIKDQITAVNIEGELDVTLNDMMNSLIFGETVDIESSTAIPKDLVEKTYEKMARALKE